MRVERLIAIADGFATCDGPLEKSNCPPQIRLPMDRLVSLLPTEDLTREDIHGLDLPGHLPPAEVGAPAPKSREHLSPVRGEGHVPRPQFEDKSLVPCLTCHLEGAAPILLCAHVVSLPIVEQREHEACVRFVRQTPGRLQKAKVPRKDSLRGHHAAGVSQIVAERRQHPAEETRITQWVRDLARSLEF